MPSPSPNPWRKLLVRELRAGRMKSADAARIAGVSRERIRQWCAEEGFDARAQRAQALAQLYATELLKMARHGRVVEDKRPLAPFMAKLVKRKPRRIKPSKEALRDDTDSKVIDFLLRGGKIKKLPMKPRSKL